MKINPKAKPRGSTIIDMVPMINFAFLLLIFVMLVGAMSVPDLLPVRPPQSTSQAKEEATPDVLVIDAAGHIGFQGEVMDLPDLPAKARAWQATAAERPLQVKADASVEAQQVVQVLEALRAAGIAKVSLLTSQRR